MIKVTVITICYNAEKCIEKTMKSVLYQNYKNIEYILVDGKSTDNTIDIIKKFSCYNNVLYISEKDTGIYNAMNKGINRSTGDYIIFMNAGDVFYNRRVVSNLVFEIQKRKVDVLWGRAILNYHDRIRIFDYQKMTLKKLLGGRMPSHQATIAKTSFLQKYPFDESFKLRADFNWFVKCYKLSLLHRCDIRCINTMVCIYLTGGASDRPKNADIMHDETVKSFKNNLPIIYQFYKNKIFL